MRTRPGPFVIYAVYDAEGTLVAYLVGTLHVPDGVPLLGPGMLLRVLHEWSTTTILEADLSRREELPSLDELRGPLLTQVAEPGLLGGGARPCPGQRAPDAGAVAPADPGHLARGRLHGRGGPGAG